MGKEIPHYGEETKGVDYRINHESRRDFLGTYHYIKK